MGALKVNLKKLTKYYIYNFGNKFIFWKKNTIFGKTNFYFGKFILNFGKKIHFLEKKIHFLEILKFLIKSFLSGILN